MKAALYIRLSREDDNDGPSESVTNQQSLLTRYAEEKHFEIYDIYIDDGWSGCNFDRPAFRRLLDDIEAKKIDTVITKDLSRLGRDYILTGHYLERYFPEHRIRYISLLDGIDTALDSSVNDITPFRAIMNDMYAKDISKKIKSVKRNKQKQGQFIGPKALFGYQKHPDNKNQLIIDEAAAQIVRRIFHMALQGDSCRAIAQQLNLEQIPSPAVYAGLKNSHPSPTGTWSSERISDLLQNETYLGHMVQGRRIKPSYKSMKSIRQSRDDWIIIKHTHQPIVDEDTFNTVQQLIKNRRHTRCRTYDHPLKGLIFCKECGHPLGVIHRKNKNGSGTLYFICRTHQRFSENRSCSPHCIKVQTVIDALSETIHSLYSSLIPENSLIETAYHIMHNTKEAQQTVNSRELLLQKVEILSAQIDTLYRDRLNHQIEEEDFSRIYNGLIKERTTAQKLLSNISSLSSADITQYSNELVTNFITTKEIDRTIFVKLIHRIELTREKSILVHFKFSDSPSHSVTN